MVSLKHLFPYVSLGSGKKWKNVCVGAREEENCNTGKSLDCVSRLRVLHFRAECLKRDLSEQN